MTEERIHLVRVRWGADQVRAAAAFRTRAEAEDWLAAETRPGDGRQHWIEEADTTGTWWPPALPTPRDRFTTRVTTTSRPDVWETSHVEVLEGGEVIAEYDRNYRMLDTFEPFRQGGRNFALISPHYTATSVMDLSTGDIIATEEPAERGFCPAGFHVPDWWDVHDATNLPGERSWRPEDHEWPTGDFGFVWGCEWGDDASWKVQHLDLSAIREGVIRREERYGYLRLATDPRLKPADFLRCYSHSGKRGVEFAVRRNFLISTGEPLPDKDW